MVLEYLELPLALGFGCSKHAVLHAPSIPPRCSRLIDPVVP